ncbi:MAG: hypothetical protein JNK58_08575 [Phycisphaerae bacterium]|nr:hypothetical protein [Phycisphaerae bacterium]
MRHSSGLLVVLPIVLASCSAPMNGEANPVGSERARHVSPALRLSDAQRKVFEENLAVARAAYDADPTNEDAIIWLGRRLAYLGRYDEAIDIYSRGRKTHPQSVKILRHRGHRYLTTRRFDLASKDLQRAADLIRENHVPDEIEPDGLPNARNIPLTTLHDNVYYHLALTRYLRGQFEKAAEAWRGGLERVKPNDDMLVAYTFWLYLAESRSGRPERAAALLAPITPNLDIIENGAYLRVLRVAKGELTEAEALGAGAEGVEGAASDRATLLHGLGALALIRGDLPSARSRFEECLRLGQWPAFGCIAAETELARMDRSRGAPAEPRTGNEILRELQQERQQHR